MRDVLERASARATAMRVAVGSVARRFLDELGITVLGHVRAIGAVAAKTSFPPDRTAVMNSPVYCQDEAASKRMVAAIETAAAQGDTLGGVIEVAAGMYQLAWAAMCNGTGAWMVCSDRRC